MAARVTTNSQRVILAAAGTLWVLGLGVGLRAIWKYEVTPGTQAVAPTTWPEASRLDRNADGFTLVLAAHPHCPCTRASIDNLARVLSRLQRPVKSYVLLLRPSEFSKDWEKTEIWARAERIAGATVVTDIDGAEAALFDARTSGYTAVYDPGGRLVFSGGLTSARGHPGESTSQNQLVSLVNGGGGRTVVASSVFGCALRHESNH
jgi:hypothetical protein